MRVTQKNEHKVKKDAATDSQDAAPMKVFKFARLNVTNVSSAVITSAKSMSFSASFVSECLALESARIVLRLRERYLKALSETLVYPRAHTCPSA